MANIKKWNICTKKEYGQDKKAFWPNVGQMTYFPASGEKKVGFKLELNMYPTTAFYVFEQTEKQEAPNPAAAEEVNADEIPF